MSYWWGRSQWVVNQWEEIIFSCHSVLKSPIIGKTKIAHQWFYCFCGLPQMVIAWNVSCFYWRFDNCFKVASYYDWAIGNAWDGHVINLSEKKRPIMLIGYSNYGCLGHQRNGQRRRGTVEIDVLGLAWEPLFLPNPHWDHSGKCLVNAQSWHVMIDKRCTPEPQQPPKDAQGYIIKPGSAV